MERDVVTTKGICRRNVGQLERQGTIIGGCAGKGQDHYRNFFPFCMLSGNRTEALRVSVSPRCHSGFQKWVQATPTTERTRSKCQSLPPVIRPGSMHRLPPPLRDTRAVVNHCPCWCDLQEYMQALHLHIPCEGDNGQGTLRKEAEGIQTKSSPHAKNIKTTQVTQGHCCM